MPRLSTCPSALRTHPSRYIFHSNPCRAPCSFRCRFRSQRQCYRRPEPSWGPFSVLSNERFQVRKSLGLVRHLPVPAKPHPVIGENVRSLSTFLVFCASDQLFSICLSSFS